MYQRTLPIEWLNTSESLYVRVCVVSLCKVYFFLVLPESLGATRRECE